MKKIYALFFSLTSVISWAGTFQSDTTEAVKALILGFDITGPAINAFNHDITRYEGFISYRMNFKYYGVVEAGYGSYGYSQYNYSYSNHGYFGRIGIDLNMLKQKTETMNHYAGIGFRYGLSFFNQETSSLSYENYWGEYNSSIPDNSGSVHFLEFIGGIKAELFRNVLIGWSLRLKLLLSRSFGDNNRPVDIPGMSGTDGGINTGILFYIAWQIPFNSKSPGPD
ncbi:MAG: DUF6048 family protein [Bacteroidales bacterium]|nr:DUF6048 family protein [Bacteroidales bacterium]